LGNQQRHVGLSGVCWIERGLRKGKEGASSTYRSLSVIHMQKSESKGETVFLKSGLVRLDALVTVAVVEHSFDYS
jgi:hypothetical protein